MEPARTAPSPSAHQIVVLSVDLVKTCLVPAGNRTWKRMTAELYRSEFGLTEAELPDDQIEADIHRIRSELAGIKHHPVRWPIVNMLAGEHWLTTLDRSVAEAREKGQRIYDRITGDPELYTVYKRLIDMLAWARAQGIRVVLNTTTDPEDVETMCSYHNIGHLFDAAYCASEIGAFKPDPAVWEHLIEKESAALGFAVEPSQVLHIGNSANSDIGAAALGIPVLLYNRDRELVALQGDLSEFDPSTLRIPEQDPADVVKMVEAGQVIVHTSVESLHAKLRSLISGE